jgi:nucleotide-binding universal stress UspA family protein
LLKTDHILLASHGTPGGRAADAVAISLCTPDSELFHLTVVPDLWRGMMGDDWLSNASTRDDYGKHVESELAREIEEHRRDVEAAITARGARYRVRAVIGKPAACLIACAAEVRPDLVVIGSPRPPGSPGLRSRMLVDELVKALSAPLLVVPYPR